MSIAYAVRYAVRCLEKGEAKKQKEKGNIRKKKGSHAQCVCKDSLTPVDRQELGFWKRERKKKKEKNEKEDPMCSVCIIPRGVCVRRRRRCV